MVKRATRDGPKSISFPLTPKLRAYLWDLVDEDGFGDDPTNVVQTLVWQRIDQLIDKDALTRRRGKYAEDDPSE